MEYGKIGRVAEAAGKSIGELGGSVAAAETFAEAGSDACKCRKRTAKNVTSSTAGTTNRVARMRIRGRCERRFGFESWTDNEFILAREWAIAMPNERAQRA